MHVTLVSGVDPAGSRGGTRSYVVGLASRLRSRDISVSLVARNGGAPQGIDYVRIRSGPSSVRFLLRLLASAPALAIPASSIIHAQRPDDLAAFMFAKRRNPKVCTLHGIPAHAIHRRKGAAYGLMYRALERAGLRRTARVIAVDPGTAAWYTRRYPWLAERTVVVPVAVDTDRFRPMDRQAARTRWNVRAKHALLYAGRLSMEKRVAEIIQAIPGVPGTELLIAGEGPDESRLRTLARTAAVRFLGPVAHDQMPQLMNAADALVLVSEYEGMPTVVVEALACGIPVVATPVGGIPEIVVPGRTGWLVPDRGKLREVLSTAVAEGHGLREACVDTAQPYAWERVVDRIVAVYRQAEADA